MNEQLPVATKFKATKEHKKMKTLDAIKLLNKIARYKLGPSKIEGVGVVAIYPIKKGDKLNIDAIPHAFDIPYRHFHKINKYVREIILGHWPNVINGSHFLYPVTKFSAYLNHSDDPNYDAKNDIALKDIKEGEEITEDYRLIEGYDKIFPFLVSKEN